MIDSTIPIHPKTLSELSAYCKSLQSTLISGAPGCGVDLVTDVLINHLSLSVPGIQITVVAGNDNAIAIDDVRNLKVLLKHRADPDANRVVFIKSADRMTTEAQNSLLKILEEPGERTSFLLSTVHPDLLLKTIRSRVSTIEVFDPPTSLLRQHFAKRQPKSLERLLIATGGRLELISDLIESSSESKQTPFNESIVAAKKFLSLNAAQRLASPDYKLSDRTEVFALVEAIGVVLGGAMRLQAQANNTSQLENLINKIGTTDEVREMLAKNANVKLAVTKLSLAL